MLAVLALMSAMLVVIIMTVLTLMNLWRQDAVLATVCQALRTQHTVHESEGRDSIAITGTSTYGVCLYQTLFAGSRPS